MRERPERRDAKHPFPRHDLVRAMNLVRKDVEEHLRVGLGAQVSLVRQLALLLESRPQLLRVRQVAVVDLSVVGCVSALEARSRSSGTTPRTK